MFNSRLLVAALLATCAATSFAQSPALDASAAKKQEWREHHPRRAQVNARLANQDRRIHQEVKEGDISQAKAVKLHREDRRIRQEERDMAAQNGGHITKGEQRVLNQQENKVSQQIGK